jgi:hypothetical protein
MRFDLRKLAIFPILLTAASAAEGQLWTGTATVGVRVEAVKGLPVEGARVELRLADVDPPDGPPPVLTDARGRADVSGLAAGNWVLEVSREGFMTYRLQLTLDARGRLREGTATQVNVPGAQRLFEVQVHRGRPVPATPAAPAAPRERVPEAAPAPRPETRPETAPVSREETPREETPREERPTTPLPGPVEPAPSLPAPEPAPIEPAPAPIELEPAPVEPAPAGPEPDAVRTRSFRDRTCPECPPGESSLSIERVLPSGGGAGSCGPEIAERLRGGEVPADLPPGCHVLKLAVPAGQRYTGYRFEVQDGNQSLDCLAGKDCPGGTGRWPMDPVLVRNPEGTVVLAPFEAGPAGRERRAVFTIYLAGK